MAPVAAITTSKIHSTAAKNGADYDEGYDEHEQRTARGASERQQEEKRGGGEKSSLTSKRKRGRPKKLNTDTSKSSGAPTAKKEAKPDNGGNCLETAIAAEVCRGNQCGKLIGSVIGIPYDLSP